jgi:hypothetical protein
MKSSFTLTLIFALFTLPLLAQQGSKSIEKRIEIIDGDEPTVTITTTEEGKTTITELSGDAARAYIDEHKKEPSPKRSVVEINITEEGIDEVKESIKKVKVEIDREMDELDKAIESIHLDSLLEGLGLEIERTVDEVKYQFKTVNGQGSSVIIMHSDCDEASVDVDVKVDVKEDGSDTEKEVTIVRKSMVVEDDESDVSKKSDLSTLKVYPVPSDGDIDVSFDNQSDIPVHIDILNAEGKVVRTMKLKGKGHKDVKMNLDTLPAGSYQVIVTQGKSRAVKKLILE